MHEEEGAPVVTDKTSFVAVLAILAVVGAARADDTNLARGRPCKFFSSIEADGWSAPKLTDGKALAPATETPATVYVPTGDAAGITESGAEAARAEGVKSLRTEAGRVVFRLGGGVYRFESCLPKQATQGSSTQGS